MSRDRGKPDSSAKLFITNLPPNIQEDKLKEELEKLFQIFGPILHLNTKKNKNGQYSFAFLQFEKNEDAIKATEQMDQKQMNGRPMKVRQDRQMEGCFNCKKEGHFAKQCPEKQRDNQYRRSPQGRRSRYKENSRSRHEDSRSRRKSPQRHSGRYRRQRSQYSDEYRKRDYRRQKNYGRQRSPRSRSRSKDRNHRRRDNYQREQDHGHKYRRQRYSRSRSYSRTK